MRVERTLILGLILLSACSSGLDEGGLSQPGTGTGGVGATGGSGTDGAAGAGAGGSPAGGFGGIGGAGAAGSGGDGVGGVGGVGGDGAGGTGVGGTAGDGAGGVGGTGGGTGTCCPSGDCICREPPPTGLSSRPGPFKTESFSIAGRGTVHYPTDAEPPFAGVALCGGFLNTGPEMASWGPFYASYGIVTIITTTSGSDQPATRAQKLGAAVEALKAENTKSGSPLMGKMADRYGTSGYSMGGGGTTIASGSAPTNKTSVGLATYGGRGTGVEVPTLLLCGSSDTTAPCSMSQSVYRSIPETTPKMMLTIQGGSHLTGWFSPTANQGASGEIALAFQKVFLEGDERWKPLLSQARGTATTNIQ